MIAVLVCLTATVEAKYSGGTGEPNDPYKIATSANLLTLAADANDYNKCFILTADIDLDPCLSKWHVFSAAVIAADIDNVNWDFDGVAFSGVFDGAGYKIVNLNINGVGNNYLGLFGCVLGEIKNLGIENTSITGGWCGECGCNSNEVGVLVGENRGDISNCYSAGDVNGGINCWEVGGLVGYNSEGSISNCFSTGTVTAEDTSYQIGGLVGFNDGNISNCCSTSIVSSGDNSEWIGGLVGENLEGSISNCYATGNVTGGNNSNELGGLVGEHNYSSISNCYATGNVTGGNNTARLGGLVGDNWGIIRYCYSTGVVSGCDGSLNLGGLVGWAAWDDIYNCYFLDVAGPNNGSGTPLTDAQMKQQASFAGWDFSTPVWRINEGRCYPYLAWEKFGGGSGTPTNPYRIWTVADLLAMAADTNDYDKNFLLMNDLDLDPNLPGNKVFNTAVIAPFIYFPPGFQGVSYTGVFDGMGHKIFNLTIEANSSTWNDSIGFIGRVYYGEVKNVGLENVRITCDNNSYSVGGLLGLSNAGTIRNCYSTGIIACGSKTNFAGGLVGYNVGGGWIGDFNSIVNNCYSSCSVTAWDNSEYIGGLAGYNRYIGGNISDCFSTGNVSAGPSSRYVGGLTGCNGGTNFDCYSTGVVTAGSGSSLVGAFAGKSNGSITSSYFLVTSGPDNGCGTPLADEEMKQQGNFVGWDFNDIWHICETTNYPKLIWQILPADIACPDGVDIWDLALLCDEWLLERIPSDLAPPGGDGIVDFADFAVFADQWGVSEDIDTLLDFAEQWLKVGLPNHSADIWPSPGGDGIVNFADLAVMANYWLEGL